MAILYLKRPIPDARFCNILVFNVYAPTSCADNRDKDMFYVELQLLTNSLPKNDMVIIGKNWNALVGHNIAAMTSIIGKYGIRIWCANEKLFRFAEQHKQHEVPIYLTNISYHMEFLE